MEFQRLAPSIVAPEGREEPTVLAEYLYRCAFLKANLSIGFHNEFHEPLRLRKRLWTT